MKTYFLLSFLVAYLQTSIAEECNTRTLENGNSVCVCNSTYCDTVPPLQTPTPGSYQIYTTSSEQLGFAWSEGDFIEGVDIEDVGVVSIDRTEKYQNIVGFGGAFTDAAGINVESLPEAAKQNLLESYFGEKGLGYTLCRVPIGGTDFSTRPYSYDDNAGDIDLEEFELQEEDLNFKIPHIQEAKELLGNRSLKLFGTAWTAPPWMKTNDAWTGVGVLETTYYQTWANYNIKFLDAYEEYGIEFWGVTTGNEPLDGYFPSFVSEINAMGWGPVTQNEWIGNNFGPTLRNSTHSNVKIILVDDNRITLPLAALVVDNDLTLSFADGVAVHWYEDDILPWSYLNFVKTDKKDLFLIMTEACNGFLHALNLDVAVDLGSWARGADYITSILNYMENGAGGWVDWNMALDVDGGPSYVNNTVDSPIIVNATAGEFYKQPMFYAIGHFAKFVLPDSVRISSSVTDAEGVQSVAFERPDNLTAIVIYNSNTEDVELQVGESGYTTTITVPASSINTLIY